MKAAVWCVLLCVGALGVEIAGARVLTEAEVRQVEQAIPALPAGLPETEVMRRLGLDPIRQFATATVVGGQAPDFSTVYTLGAAGQLAVTLRGEQVVRVDFSRRAGAAPTAVWPATSADRAETREVPNDAPPRPSRWAAGLDALMYMVSAVTSSFLRTIFFSLVSALFVKVAVRLSAGASISYWWSYVLCLAIYLLSGLLSAMALAGLIWAGMDLKRSLGPFLWLMMGILFLSASGVFSRIADEQTGLAIGWWRGIKTTMTYIGLIVIPYLLWARFVHYMISP